MHNIKEINFEAIIILLKNIDYRDGTNNIKLCKGRYKLPKIFSNFFTRVKK